MSKATFVYTQDPGHGWLEVPRQLLSDLGIEYDISPYSYIKGANAYLEEDCDMSLFCQEFEAEFPERNLDIKPHHINFDSPIRNYRPYPMTRPRATA